MSHHHPLTIACFITPHGFGHASRAAAVLAALEKRIPEIRFELFTTSPPQVFADSLSAPFRCHSVVTDLGMVQLSPLELDIEATCEALDQLMPFDPALIDRLAAQVQAASCCAVFCDIAAMGIAVARQAGLPSILVENFTWDWIYQAYPSHAARLQRHITYLNELYAAVDLHIQTEPLCRAAPGRLRTPPISRQPRSEPAAVRRKLGIPLKAKMILVSMGGIPDDFAFLEDIAPPQNLFLVVPAAGPSRKTRTNIILLPAHSEFYHPDLIQAADVLIGKAGYSTIAEAYYAGIPFGHIDRSDSPEAPILEAFVCRSLPGCPISIQDYRSGRWLHAVPRLLDMPRLPRHQRNGAETAADPIYTLLARLCA